MNEPKKQAAGTAGHTVQTGTKASRRQDDRSSGGKARPVPEEARRRMVAEAAYFRAERRDFTPGGEFEDWVEAEAEVERLLSGDTSGTDRSEATRR